MLCGGGRFVFGQKRAGFSVRQTEALAEFGTVLPCGYKIIGIFWVRDRGFKNERVVT